MKNICTKVSCTKVSVDPTIPFRNKEIPIDGVCKKEVCKKANIIGASITLAGLFIGFPLLVAGFIVGSLIISLIGLLIFLPGFIGGVVSSFMYGDY